MNDVEISIFTPTYNRVNLLKISLSSILKQTYKNFEIILVDDCSTDETSNYINQLSDPRIKKYKNEKNLGQIHGDKIMFEKFIYEQARGKYILYLCDDDYWNDDNLLENLHTIIDNNKDISMAFTGVGQKYPKPLENLPIPNVSYISYEYINENKNIIFAKNIYPEGVISSENFLKLFAEDPANRNLGLGAAIWRKDLLIKANLKKTKEIKRQMGWWYFISSGVQGNVFYLNQPGYISMIDTNTLSFSLTQKNHLLDCLSATAVGFEVKPVLIDKSTTDIYRNKTLKAIVHIYLSNKYAAKLGFFKNNPIGDINDLFNKEISVGEFISISKKFDIKLNIKDYFAIIISALPNFLIFFLNGLLKKFNGVFWWKKII